MIRKVFLCSDRGSISIWHFGGYNGGHDSVVAHNNSNNDSIKTKGRCKNLDNKHRNEGLGLLCVSVNSSWANNSDGHSASSIADSDNKSSEEKAVASVLGVLEGSGVHKDIVHNFAESTLDNNSNNKTVNGNGFAENNTDKIFCYDTRHLDCWTENRSTSCEDSPVQMLVKYCILTMQLQWLRKKEQLRHQGKPRIEVGCSRKGRTNPCSLQRYMAQQACWCQWSSFLILN